MKIVVAPNAFKGSLTSPAAAGAMARGVTRAAPGADIVEVPVADGGDGLIEVVTPAVGGKLQTARVTGPLGKAIDAAFCHVPATGLAVVEMAQASGLALLADDERGPGHATTRGTGELIAAALDLGVSRVAVGLGGSATIDGGIGVATALGALFLDGSGAPVEPVGASLPAIRHIDMSRRDTRIDDVEIEALCDVDNPLCGPEGASRVYGPQKGATPDQIEALDAGLAHLADVIDADLGIDIRNLPGAGAAGGLGAGLAAFVGAELRPGADRVLEMVGLQDRLAGADLVITGEGRFDAQTARGKAPAGVAAAARAVGVPCVAIVGQAGEDVGDLHDLGIDAVFALADGPTTLDESMRDATALLTRTTEHAVRLFLAARRDLKRRAT